jgi:hypothetical protein
LTPVKAGFVASDDLALTESLTRVERERPELDLAQPRVHAGA